MDIIKDLNWGIKSSSTSWLLSGLRKGGLWGLLLILQIVACKNQLQAQAQTKVGGFAALPMDNPSILGVQFTLNGDQTAYPVMELGKLQVLQLDFDDKDLHPKSYNYTYTLCDENWEPVLLSAFDYLKGFNQGRVKDYKYSSIAITKYIHYKALLPLQECFPTKSGNYLLKIFLDGDTSKLAFCRRMLVVDPKVTVTASVKQPVDAYKASGFQKLQFSIDVARLQVQNPQQQIKVVVLQNYRWDNAVRQPQPSFMRGPVYEYNGERDFLFEAGKEYRWVDLQSFRFQSERIDHVDATHTPMDIYVKTDESRDGVQYMPYADYNGFYKIASTESIDPWWQGDYALVHFSYRPKEGKAYTGQDLYLLSQLNAYQYNENSKLLYNATKGDYEITLLMKQGYYSYLYALKPTDSPLAATIKSTEGNYWETENDYTILVYYQSYADRAPQLVACRVVNSRK